MWIGWIAFALLLGDVHSLKQREPAPVPRTRPGWGAGSANEGGFGGSGSLRP
ncbi:hypothetical protein GCM10027064_16000 [Microbacterium petrolearium]